MAAFIYLAYPDKLSEPATDIAPILLDDNGAYWFLYRYFQAAKLSTENGDLIDLYDGGVIDGYQLHRLKTELDQALVDIWVKPETWYVLTGWAGLKDVASEIWSEVQRIELIQIVNNLLALIGGVSGQLKLVYSGD